MKTLYLDCQSGISGDMTLSALIDLGADIDYIREHLHALPIDPFELNVIQVEKRGISSKQLDLHFANEVETHTHDHSHSYEHTHSHSHEHTHDHDDHHHHHEHRKAATILTMIRESALPMRVKQRSLAVFEVIALAEGKIHGMDPQEVHFHEVGAMDSIIDIIGVCLALESLNIDKIISSPVPTGYGKIMIAHGLYPIPAPATAEILTGVPLLDFEVEGELTTPTGAGFVKALASEYGRMPALAMANIGYGAGKKNFAHPNVLRAVLFNEDEDTKHEDISVLECQLDDTTGEALGYVMEKLLAAGALDVYFTAVTMKKSRPGTLITVLTLPENVFVLEDILLRETTTFGVRKSQWTRRILAREFIKVVTEFGEVTVKVGKVGDEIIKMSPEYEDVKQVAIKNDVTLLAVYNAVNQALKSDEK